MTDKKFIHDENPELKKLFTSLNLTSNLKNQILKKNSKHKKNITNEKILSKKKFGYKFNKNLYLSSKNINTHFSEENKKELLSLNNAALSVQNLISGYLHNVDKEDKKKFEVDKELKEIKINKKKTMKNLINLYTKEIEEEPEEKNNFLNISYQFKKALLKKKNSYGIPGYNNDILLEKNRTFSKDLYKGIFNHKNEMIIHNHNNNNFLDFDNSITSRASENQTFIYNNTDNFNKEQNIIKETKSFKKPKQQNNKFNFFDNVNSYKKYNLKNSKQYKNKNTENNSINKFKNSFSKKFSNNHEVQNLNRNKNKFNLSLIIPKEDNFKRKKSKSKTDIQQKDKLLEQLKTKINQNKLSSNKIKISRRTSQKKLSTINRKKLKLSDINSELERNIHETTILENIKKENNKNLLKTKNLNKNQENILLKNIKQTIYQNIKEEELQQQINNDLSIKKNKSNDESNSNLILKENINNNNNKVITNESNYNLNIISSNKSYEKNDIRNFLPHLSEKNIQKFNELTEKFRKSLIEEEENEKILDKINNNNTVKKNEEEKIKIRKSGRKNSIEILKKKLEGHLLNKTLQTQLIKEFQYRRLTKQNNLVYDSISDDESLEEFKGEYYIDPNNKYKIFFDGIILSLSIYWILIPPFYFAFYSYKAIHFSSFVMLMEFIIDFFYILDLFLNFFIGYYNFEEQFITYFTYIIINYLKTWFIIDLLSAFPFNTIFAVTNYYKRKNNLTLTFTNDQTKLFEIFKLLKIFKIFKIYSQNKCIEILFLYLSDFDKLIKYLSIFIYILIFLICSHFLSCIFIFLGQITTPNWIITQELDLNGPKKDIYFTALYYICATVFTVGYGDVVSINIYEKVYNLFLLIFGIMIYSFSVSNLSNYVQSKDTKTIEYQRKTAILEQIRATNEKMSNTLYEKIIKFLYYNLNNEKKDKNDIINNLPLSLKNKLIKEMYKDVIVNFIFFKNIDNNDFIIKIILAFKPIQSVQNERLVNEGDYIEEIIFVKRGRLTLEIPLPVVFEDESIKKIESIKQQNSLLLNNITKVNFFNRKDSSMFPSELSLDNKMSFKKKSTEGKIYNNFNGEEENKEIKRLRKEINENKQQYIKIIDICRNEHFGDIYMFLNKRSPLSVKVKSKIAELFLLKKTDAIEISTNFPKIWKTIIKKSLFNMEQIERLIRKTLKFFFIHNEGNDVFNQDNNIYSKKKKRNFYYYKRDPLRHNKFLKTDIEEVEMGTDDELKSIDSFLNKNEVDNEFSGSEIDYKGGLIQEAEEEEEEEDEEEEEEDEDEEKNKKYNKKLGYVKNEKKRKNEVSKVSEVSEENLASNGYEESEVSSASKESKKSKHINKSDDEIEKITSSSKISNNTFNDKNSSVPKNNLYLSNATNNKKNINYDSDLTIKVNIKNQSIISFTDDNNDDEFNNNNKNNKYKKNNINNSFNENSNSLIESNISSSHLTMPYNESEINNEAFPFETPIFIKKTELFPNNIIPVEIFNNNIKIYNYNSKDIVNNNNNVDKDMNHNINLNNNNAINNIVSNNYKNNINSINNDNNNNNNNKEFLKTSFNLIIICNQFEFSILQNYNHISKIKNKIYDNISLNNSLKSFKTLQSKKRSIKHLNTVNSSNNNLSDVNKSNSVKRVRYFSISNNLIKPSLNPESDRRRKSKFMFYQYKNNFLNNVNNNNNNNNSKFNKFKHSNTIGQKTITNNLINKYNENNNEKSNIKRKEHNNSDNDDKTNMLDLISQNIEINSLNLNNPKYFYSNYFSNIINKKEKEKENEKNNFGSRLNNIKKLLEKHKK